MPSLHEPVARDAATVVLLTDPECTGDPPKVLLLERPPGARFAPGTQVFPGGSVDEADRDPAWAKMVQPPSEQALDLRAPLAAMLAAVRETFEETGILLARRSDGSLATPADAGSLTAMRSVVRSGRPQAFRTGLAAAGFTPDLEGLIFCAHWITPLGVATRFDTRFFMSVLPPGQVAQADPLQEHVALRWADPKRALQDAEDGLCQLLPPTRAVLRQVAAARSVEDALLLARKSSVATVQPALEEVTRENYPGLNLSWLKSGSARESGPS
jgi:8-oxo-dGTP pyrophosphatase MutT (NUDIX family)